MAGIFLANSVLTAYRTLCILAQHISDAIVEFDPLFDEFPTMGEQIKLIHEGAWTLLQIINAPRDEFTPQGLRTSEAAWANPPSSSQEAMEQLERILIAMEPWINLRNGRRLLVDHSELFLRFDEAISYVQSMHDAGAVYVGPVGETNPTPPAQQHGATDEQIARLPVHVAAGEDTGQDCCICLGSYIVGESISFLPCSHRFHRRCAESWLRECATCPVDRSRVFSN